LGSTIVRRIAIILASATGSGDQPDRRLIAAGQGQRGAELGLAHARRPYEAAPAGRRPWWAGFDLLRAGYAGVMTDKQTARPSAGHRLADDLARLRQRGREQSAALAATQRRLRDLQNEVERHFRYSLRAIRDAGAPAR